MSIKSALRRMMEAGGTLSREDAANSMRTILAGDVADVELAALLGAMAARGETAEELAGFASVMREAATMLPLSAAEQDELVDSCGTGGDGSGTFNISTGAALVAAAAGAKVAKHGNRAVTSRCGSADVLEAMGIPVGLEPQAAADALRREGFVFLLASAHHPAMRVVMPVRRALGVRTVFNVLGPLLNPAGARRQVMGVYASRLVPVVAEAMTMLGVRHAFVVHGDGAGLQPRGAGKQSGQDELALSGQSEVAEVRDGAVRTYKLLPEAFGLNRAPLSALTGGDAVENAAILEAIFAGGVGPGRDAVVFNAASVLVAAGKANSISEGVALAIEALESGAAFRLVEKLRAR